MGFLGEFVGIGNIFIHNIPYIYLFILFLGKEVGRSLSISANRPSFRSASWEILVSDLL